MMRTLNVERYVEPELSLSSFFRFPRSPTIEPRRHLIQVIAGIIEPCTVHPVLLHSKVLDLR
jgi:hypothetical protein